MAGNRLDAGVDLARGALRPGRPWIDVPGGSPESRRVFPRVVVLLTVTLVAVAAIAPAQAAVQSRAAFARSSGWESTSSSASSAAGQGCASLPAALGAMTKHGVSLITACLGYLRSGVQGQAADVKVNVHTCSVLASVPDSTWTGMSDVGSAYVSDGKTGNPAIVNRAMKYVLDYMDAASSWYERNPSSAPRGIVAAIQATTTALEDSTTLIRKFNTDLEQAGGQFTKAAHSHSCSGITAPAAALASSAQRAESKLEIALAGLSIIGSHLRS